MINSQAASVARLSVHVDRDTHAATLILFPRDGGALEAPLDNHSLINLSSARQAPQDVIESLNWIIAHREGFVNPQEVGEVFGNQHIAWLAS